MRKSLLLCTAIMGCCLGYVPLHAEPVDTPASTPTVFYLFDVNNRLNDTETAPYNLVLQELVTRTGWQTQNHVMPIARAVKTFIADAGSCEFPSSIEIFRTMNKAYENLQVIQSAWFDYVSLRIYSPADKPVFSSLEAINGKDIGVMSASVAEDFVTRSGANIVRAKTEGQLARMLDAGRIDGIMAHYPDVALASEIEGVSFGHFDPEFSVYKVPLSIVCHDTESNRRMLNRFDPVIMDMRRSGRMKELLGPHSEVVPVTREGATLKSQ